MPRHKTFYHYKPLRASADSAGSTILIHGQWVSTVSPAESKIRSFADLPVGWRYGSGGPLSDNMIERALHWHDFIKACGLVDTDAFAGANGEILLAADWREHYLEAILEIDGTVSLAYDVSDIQQRYLPHLEDMKAQEAVKEIAGNIWNASDYFTRMIFTSARIDLPASHFEIHPIMEVYQSSAQNALPPQAPTFVPIQGNITPASRENLQYFGGLPKLPSLRDTA